MHLEEIMSRSVISLAPTTTVAEAFELFLTRGIHHLLIVERSHVIGVVTVREVSGKPHELTLADVMCRDVKTASPTASVKEAAKLMIGNNSGCVPVVDGGRIVGIVTSSDLMRVLTRNAELATV